MTAKLTIEQFNVKIASKIGPPGGVPVVDLHVFSSRVILNAALEVLVDEINDMRTKLSDRAP